VSPQKPARRRDCPPWCEGTHDPGDMHYREVGRVQLGPASIEVSVRYQPGNYACYPPLITVTAWNAPATTVPGLPAAEVRPLWAGNLADLLAVLGHDDPAGRRRSRRCRADDP
jgi:hypothetical protein